MAFTFIIEDGTGVASANSYVTVAEANDYIESNAKAFLAWKVLGASKQERLLAWATRYIEYRMDFCGTKLNVANTLAWPRTGAYDHENNLIADTTIPIRLKQASMELTRFLLVRDLGESLAQDGLVSLIVDVVELEFVEGFVPKTIPDDVFLLISSLGTIRNPTGHSFGRIKRS